MPYFMWFGKYKGASLEEIALGKKAPQGGGKSEGYYYFNQLAQEPRAGQPDYFRMFRTSAGAMKRWTEIHDKLNGFVAAYPCAVCKKDPTTNPPVVMTVIGDRDRGYSIGAGYIACADRACQQTLQSYHHGVFGIRLGFDAILRFGWSAGGKKADEKHFANELLTIAGWKPGSRITAEKADEFIYNLKTR